MGTDVERRLEETYGHLEPDARIRDRILGDLPERKRTPRRLAWLAPAALGAAACLLVIAILRDGAEPEGPERARLSFRAEGAPEAVSRVMAARLRARGIEEVELRTGGPAGEIEVLVPADSAIEELFAMLLRPGTLELRLVVESEGETPSPETVRWVSDSEGGGAWVEEPEDRRERFGGEDIDPEGVHVEADPLGIGWLVRFEMREDRREDFSALTGRNVGRKLAIIVDGVLESAPVIRERLPGGGQITGGGVGGFGREEAESLAAVLRSGPLPSEVERR
jgi:preprotein translocase subunit SecD